MLHKALKAYLDTIEQTIVRQKHLYVERYVEEILTPERVNLHIRLRARGYLLEIHEAVIVSEGLATHLDYRYHCQNAQNCLQFRYDSTPHFPNVLSFPHHKHLSDGSVIASYKPDVRLVIQEAMNISEGAE